jgi:formamidopyrimidine-DNA glycosylase
MPELPEVETVRRGLIPIMNNKNIVRLDQRRQDLRWPLPQNMPKRLQNVKIEDISRRSKYLLLKLSSEETLIIHLGMSGRLLALRDSDETTTQVGNFNFDTHKIDKHDHIIIHLEGGIRVVYNDPRRFGAMDLVPTVQINSHKWFANLGPEPLGNRFSSDYLYLKLQKKKSSIKAALMDQNLVSGLGNIYVLESLWLSGISPIRKAHNIKKSEADELTASIRSVLTAAIDAGGTSLQDFRQVGGDLGYFKQSLNVYGRFDQKCKSNHCSGTIRRLKQSGRTSYYCDRCQK